MSESYVDAVGWGGVGGERNRMTDRGMREMILILDQTQTQGHSNFTVWSKAEWSREDAIHSNTTRALM